MEGVNATREGSVDAEDILRSIREFQRKFPQPVYDRLRVGSLLLLESALRERVPDDPRVGLPLSYAGFPVTVDEHLPKHMAVLIGQPRGIFGTPRIAMIDMRRRPWTDDMVQMLADLQSA